MRNKLVVLILSFTTLLSCNGDLQCERLYFPKDYIGDVVIYFDQKNGQKSIDKDGCQIYRISLSGKCLSGFSLKDGTAVPNETIKYFEVIDKNRTQQIPEFDPHEYYSDSTRNSKKKYVYFIASGYQNPHFLVEYFVDYGFNHKKYDNF